MKPAGSGGGWILVWDLPIRVCHWGLALCLSAALFLGWGFAPESEEFAYHMPVGWLAAWFLAVRIALGFGGSVQTRWSAFLHRPAQVGRYFAAVARGRTTEDGPLNPGTALFALAAYLGLAGLIATGYDADWAETWHAPLARGVLGLILCHFAGLALHAGRHRAWTPLAMLHGRTTARDDDGPAAPRRSLGVVILVISGLLTWLVLGCFDPGTATLACPLLPEIGFPLVQKG